MKESALYADTQDTSQLNTQMCHDTSQLTKDTLQLNLVEQARTARLRHCTLHEATSGARSAVGEPLRAPVLAPRLGEAVGSVDRACALLRLLGQGTEDVPLGRPLASSSFSCFSFASFAFFSAAIFDGAMPFAKSAGFTLPLFLGGAFLAPIVTAEVRTDTLDCTPGARKALADAAARTTRKARSMSEIRWSGGRDLSRASAYVRLD